MKSVEVQAMLDPTGAGDTQGHSSGWVSLGVSRSSGTRPVPGQWNDIWSLKRVSVVIKKQYFPQFFP